MEKINPKYMYNAELGFASVLEFSENEESGEVIAFVRQGPEIQQWFFRTQDAVTDSTVWKLTAKPKVRSLRRR